MKNVIIKTLFTSLLLSGGIYSQPAKFSYNTDIKKDIAIITTLVGSSYILTKLSLYLRDKVNKISPLTSKTDYSDSIGKKTYNAIGKFWNNRLTRIFTVFSATEALGYNFFPSCLVYALTPKNMSELKGTLQFAIKVTPTLATFIAARKSGFIIKKSMTFKQAKVL